MEFKVDIAMVVLEAVITAVILQFVQCRGAEQEAPPVQVGVQPRQQYREHREDQRGQCQS